MLFHIHIRGKVRDMLRTFFIFWSSFIVEGALKRSPVIFAPFIYLRLL